MAAENIDNTVGGTGLFNAKIPGLSDSADIQAALRLYHYGTYEYDGSNTNTALIPNPSVAHHFQKLTNDKANLSGANFTGPITTPNNTASRISFYYSTLASFPAASTAHGAIAHAHDTGKMYFAHSGQWLELASESYVTTSVTNAIAGATGGYPGLAGEAIDWNSVDLRFDVVPQLANVGTVITKTESFTLSPEDVGKTAVLYSSNPMVVTLPANASVEIPVGYSIDIIQTGTGSVTVSEGSGAVSINSKAGIKSLDGQYSKGTLVKIDTNIWFFFWKLT